MVTPHIVVRPATPESAEFVLGLVEHLVAFAPPRWRDREQMIETDKLVIGRALKDLSNNAGVLVAEDADGKPLGFIHLCSEVDYYTRAECGHVADIVVAPAERGRGVGEALIAAGEEWARARGYSLLTLNVFVENVRARALYERTGFGAETLRYVKTLAAGLDRGHSRTSEAAKHEP